MCAMTLPRTLPRLVVLRASAVLAAALAVGCTTPPTPPADPTASPAPNFGAGDMPPGTHVQVAKQGQWWPAVIVQPMGEGRFLIHYDNADDCWNEVVGPDRLKPLASAGPARDYHPGERVLVTYKGRLLVGEIVMQVAADSWRVHYDGFGPEAAESVGADRIRRPFTGPSGHAVGETVVVDVNGQQLHAKILAASSADHWIVRYDNFGPEYDQEVGVDRIRVAAAAAPPPPPAAAPPAPPAPPKPVVAAPPPPKAKPSAPPPVSDAPSVPAGPPAVGEQVLVSLHGAWFSGTVTAVGASAIKVKYAAGGEEELPADHVLREPTSTRGQHYQPGQLVLIDYKGVFVPGKVLRQEGKDYKIRFDGQGPAGDEILPSIRLRPR